MDRTFERLFRLYFSPDDGGGEGGSEKSDPPKDEEKKDGEGDPPGGEPEKFDADYVKSLRDENAKARRKQRDLETELQKLRDRDLSETEKKERELKDAQEQATRAQERYRAKAVQAAVAMQAGALEIVDAEAAILFIQGQVEFDEEGEPQNVDRLLKDLVKAKPYLVKPKEKGGLPPSGQRPGGGNGKTEPSDEERKHAANVYASRF